MVKTFILETGQQNALQINHSVSRQELLVASWRTPCGMSECPHTGISLVSQVIYRGRDTISQQEIIPLLDDACILPSGIQCTVLCLRAKNLESGWEHQLWFSLSQWPWRELINTQLTGSSSLRVMMKAGHVWGCEGGRGWGWELQEVISVPSSVLGTCLLLKSSLDNSLLRVRLNLSLSELCVICGFLTVLVLIGC